MRSRPASDRIPAWWLAVGAMLMVQLGAVVSVQFFPVVGPAGTAWLRLTAGAIIFVALNPPKLKGMSRRDAATLLLLGVATGLFTLSFLTAVDRIPLGTAVAIEFLGPITVGVVRAGSLRNVVWPLIAIGGVVLLTEPWAGNVDPGGVVYAGLAAVGWGTYIVLTQRVGDRFDGLDGLSITIPIAAVVAGFVGIPQALPGLSWLVVLAAFGLAVLMPVLPFSLELLALRRMTVSSFGTFMSLEPAIGLVAGALLLSQIPSPTQLVGIVCVVCAGAGAQRSSTREPAEIGVITPG